MATRIFCDHCGNTITNPNVYCYGPWPDVQALAYSAAGGAGGAGVGGGGNSRASVQWVGAAGVQTYQSVAPASNLAKVDLCNACVPIWTERVRNLTKASDVDV